MDELGVRAFLDDAYPRIVAVVTLVCGSQAAAEDAVQEALVRAWERKQGLDNPEAWITTVALNLARCSTQRRRRLPSRTPTPSTCVGPSTG
jgi:DNA-directed RNA polymerase specialized sigma24 family protein